MTTFGKLMDPLADKLLIVAALVSLVSLGRLEAWIAMVIIARELAVTGLRAVAVEQGVVIAASWLGKVKTALQIAAMIALIAVDPATLAVDLLVYAAVAVTVISGADYFFGVRRRIERAARRPTRDGDAGEAPSVPARARREPRATPASSCGRGSARRSRARASDLGELAPALGDDVVAMDRLEVLLAGEDESAGRRRARGGRRRRWRTISRTQSSTKRGLAWAFSTTERSSSRFISS